MQFFYLLKKFFTKIILFLNKTIFSKNFLKLFFVISAMFFIVFSPNFIFNQKNYETNLNEILNLSNKQKVILNLWHIETFEGGSNSRTKFLEKQAIKFNKENNNCFISVTTLTEEQLFLNLKNNKFPDMFSFGIGSGCLISGLLEELQLNNQVRKDLIDYGKVNNSLFAYPYILSGYAIISYENLLNNDQFDNFKSKMVNKKEIKGITFANDGFINLDEILICNNYKDINQNDYYTSSSTYNAYVNFINKKSISLLGTARDVSRCKNRESNGSLSSCKYTFLPGFSDLVQYIGVVKNIEKVKKDYAFNFSNFLLEDSCQKDLKNYGLFSTTIDIYKEEYMDDFESVLTRPLKSTNVFISLKEIEKLKEGNKKILFYN